MSEVNSKEYWDNRFEENWEEYNGPRQTREFIKLMLRHLPEEIVGYLETSNASVLDWGCAIGVGVDEFANRFKEATVSGLDFSDAAIEKSKQVLPQYTFVAGSLDKHETRYDIIYTSNCLEHFKDPYEWLNQILSWTNEYAIVLVPYNEELTSPWSEHQFSFKDNSFETNYKGFTKVFQKELTDCGSCWPSGTQLLVVYKKQ